jgi:hypothetical protein
VVRWSLSVVLICISFVTRDGEHFFMCFLAIWISSFEKVLFSSIYSFLIDSSSMWRKDSSWGVNVRRLIRRLLEQSIYDLIEVWTRKLFKK